jgi:hypothetical protein
LARGDEADRLHVPFILASLAADPITTTKGFVYEEGEMDEDD